VECSPIPSDAVLEIKDQWTAHTAVGSACLTHVLSDPSRKCASCVVEALSSGRTKTPAASGEA